MKTSCTIGGIQKLKAKLPNCTIVFNNQKIED